MKNKNRLNKRKLKKFNKKRHENILSQLSVFFTIEKKVFGNGYFVFTFEDNSICWFWLKELPDWKFGIWLEKDNQYRIFGEATVLIDKFKPCATTLSTNDIHIFNKKLLDIKHNKEEWKEYNNNIAKNKKLLKKCKEINNKNYQNIFNYIKREKEKYGKGEVKSYIEFKNHNSKNFKISPRYTLTQITDIEDYFGSKEDIERTKILIKDMSNLITYLGNYRKNFDFDKDDYYYDIDSFVFDNIDLINPKDYKEKEEFYGRDGNFQKMLDSINL